MSKIATTIDQSKRLLKAGVDPNSADMCWTNIVETTDEGGYFIKEREQVFHLEIGCSRYNKNIIPAWSLSALIALCPEHVPYRIIRTRGKDIEGIFEDLVEFLCRKEKEDKQ